MSVWLKKLAALIISVVIGLGLTGVVLRVFGIETAPAERWLVFPDGWRIIDLVVNSMALLMAFGAVRACYYVLHETWIRDRTASDNQPAPPAQDH